jgi:hypothetical protein
MAMTVAIIPRVLMTNLPCHALFMEESFLIGCNGYGSSPPADSCADRSSSPPSSDHGEKKPGAKYLVDTSASRLSP